MGMSEESKLYEYFNSNNSESDKLLLVMSSNFGSCYMSLIK